MKISIGTNIKDGPWGGGNLFAKNLKNYLLKNGHKVVHDLHDEDIDIILITEPRKASESSAFTSKDVENYLKFKKFETIVVHRINECDERKNTNYVNKYLINSNLISDATVFVSDWLKNLYINQGLRCNKIITIMSGSDKNIFNPTNYQPWNRTEKIKIVTHHWGANWNKGFDIYLKLDQLLDEEFWHNKIVFSYIGNLPSNYKFKNMKYFSAKSGYELANELKKNHIYLTASINEPSGNHHIEAAQCGLPILYIDSGGIPEYCNGYGVKFNSNNFESKLLEIIENYDYHLKNIKDYKYNSDNMCKEYMNLFEILYAEKSRIFKNRKILFNVNKINKYFFNLSNKIKKLHPFKYV